MADFPLPGFDHISVNPQPFPGFSPVDIDDTGFVPSGYGIDTHSQPAYRRALEYHFPTKEFEVIQSVNSIDASPYFNQTQTSPSSDSVKYFARIQNAPIFNSALVDVLYPGHGTTIPLTLQGINKILAGESGSGTATKNAVLDRQKAYTPIKFAEDVLKRLRSDAMNIADSFTFLGVYFTWSQSRVMSVKTGLDCKTRNMWDMLPGLQRLPNGSKLYLLYQSNNKHMIITPAIKGPVPESYYTPYVVPNLKSAVVRMVGEVHRAYEKNSITHIAGGFCDVGQWEQLVMTDINIMGEGLALRVDENLVKVPPGYAA